MSGLSDADPPAADPWAALRQHTTARIALGRAGTSLPTAELLRIGADHAQARDAVHIALDADALVEALRQDGWRAIVARSQAASRDVYLRRPDLGRRLDPASAAAVRAAAGEPVDLAIVLADGLSAAAVQQGAPPLLAALRIALDAALSMAPPVIALHARVALGDEVGELLNARAVLVLIGERPGSSATNSIGTYLTHAPKPGCTDAGRNCVSNIRPEGLPAPAAAARIAWLVREALRRRLSGVALKDGSDTALLRG